MLMVRQIRNAMPDFQRSLTKYVENLESNSIKVDKRGTITGDLLINNPDGNESKFSFTVRINDIPKAFIVGINIFQDDKRIVNISEIISFDEIKRERESLIVRYVAKYINQINILGIKIKETSMDPTQTTEFDITEAVDEEEDLDEDEYF